MTPARLTSPGVGRSPTTPQNDAGTRMEPPVSVPTPATPKPAATAAAVPPLEPPGSRRGSCGLRVTPERDEWPCHDAARSGIVVLPITTAPAPRRRATTVASMLGTYDENAFDPNDVAIPAVSKLSLTTTGTPCSGPINVLLERNSSSNRR